jgi:uncharacterized protein
MEEKTISKLSRFVEQELGTDHSGHGVQHTQRVVNNACKILEKEKGNEKIVVTAAYLHDCIDHKLFSDKNLQLKKIATLLQNLDCSKEEIAEISDIIQTISFSCEKSRTLSSVNAQIVCDADRLDAIGAIGIIRTIEYGASRGRNFYDEEDLEKVQRGAFSQIDKASTLAHFYDKLLLLKDLMYTQTAKDLAEKRTHFMKDFLTEFYEELDFNL